VYIEPVAKPEFCNWQGAHMFSDEVKKLFIQVISSWQVIVVTVVLVIYISIVNSVARLNRRRRPRQIAPMPREKPEASAAPSGDDDDLGLEE
jgi:hypothetical protein